MRIGFRSTTKAPDLSRCRVRRSPRVLTTSQGDEVVLLDTAGERYFTLNDVGVRIWTMLAEPSTLAEIVAAIHRDYDVPVDRGRDLVERDVEGLLRELHAAELVIAAPMPTGAS